MIVIGAGETRRKKKKSRDAEAAAGELLLTETNERCQADKPETRAANQRIIPSVLFHHGRPASSSTRSLSSLIHYSCNDRSFRSLARSRVIISLSFSAACMCEPGHCWKIIISISSKLIKKHKAPRHNTGPRSQVSHSHAACHAFALGTSLSLSDACLRVWTHIHFQLKMQLLRSN